MDIKKFYEGLDIMFRRKNPVETLRYMEDWLREAESTGDWSAAVAVSNEMGGLLRVMGNTERAKELYVSVLKNLKEMGLDHTEHYATALINEGDVFINSKEPQEALARFLKARDLLIECGLGGDYRMAALCNNISMVYRELGDYVAAEEALDKAFYIIKGIPERRSDLATTYVNLGELQVKQGKLEMAKDSFINACNIYEEKGGINTHYSSACSGLGHVYYLKGEKEKAIMYYEKTLALIERDFGKTPYYYMIEKNINHIKGV